MKRCIQHLEQRKSYLDENMYKSPLNVFFKHKNLEYGVTFSQNYKWYGRTNLSRYSDVTSTISKGIRIMVQKKTSYVSAMPFQNILIKTN